MPMIKTWNEEWIEEAPPSGLQEGREQGLLEGQPVATRRLLLMQLERRIGPLAPSVRSQIESLSLAQLEQTLLDLVSVATLAELGLGSTS